MKEEKELPKYKVFRGLNKEGKAVILKCDPKMQRTLNDVYKRVTEKSWDYVCLCCGIPGSGKSTLSQTIARYLCPWFDETYIAFSGDDFIRITNEAKENSAVILDESFQSLNSKIAMSSDFLKIINHLQLIRQKNLFIILNLPNFFDLSKGVSIFRSSHLFVVYPSQEGDRGRFLVFDRDAKRELYIKGQKFMDYNSVKANYYGRFWKNEVIPENIYDNMKRTHLLSQEFDSKQTHSRSSRDKMVCWMRETLKYKHKEIAEVSGLSEKTIFNILSRHGLTKQ